LCWVLIENKYKASNSYYTITPQNGKQQHIGAGIAHFKWFPDHCYSNLENFTSPMLTSQLQANKIAFTSQAISSIFVDRNFWRYC